MEVDLGVVDEEWVDDNLDALDALDLRDIIYALLRRVHVLESRKWNCPTCDHYHPQGTGLRICFCPECHRLFGSIASR